MLQQDVMPLRSIRLVLALLVVSHVGIPGCHAATVTHHLELSEFFSNPYQSDANDTTSKRQSVLVAGINRKVLAPTITVRQGDRLVLKVANNLTVPITFHCHGLEYRSEQYLDGVAGLTQCPIQPGQTFTYDFAVDDYPGTYWYHPHTSLAHMSSVDVMHGPLVVLPKQPQDDPHKEMFDSDMVGWWHWHAWFRCLQS